MKFLGHTDYEDGIITLFAFADGVGFEKWEGKIKTYRYNLFSRELCNGLKGNLVGIFDKNQPFTCQII